jgi:hypothetical protein
MYKPRDIIELIAGNVRKSRNPFGAPNWVINRWWKGAALPRSGDALLFTGLMYQSVPYMERTTRYLERYEDTFLARHVGLGRYVPGFLVGMGFAFMASRQDFYSGILLYDLGDVDGFVDHARFVAQTLRENGVRKVITVDPHTTYALKVLYPKYTGESFEVRTYFELVNLIGKNGVKRITLHDPCFYGRYLELGAVPRRVLEKMGIECAALRNSNQFTSCCGGPAESLSPKLSREIGGRRIAELRATAAPVVAMCPICMANLRKGGLEVEDLSTVIARCA